MCRCIHMRCKNYFVFPMREYDNLRMIRETRRRQSLQARGQAQPPLLFFCDPYHIMFFYVFPPLCLYIFFHAPTQKSLFGPIQARKTSNQLRTRCPSRPMQCLIFGRSLCTFHEIDSFLQVQFVSEIQQGPGGSL